MPHVKKTPYGMSEYECLRSAFAYAQSDQSLPFAHIPALYPGKGSGMIGIIICQNYLSTSCHMLVVEYYVSMLCVCP